MLCAEGLRGRAMSALELSEGAGGQLLSTVGSQPEIERSASRYHQDEAAGCEKRMDVILEGPGYVEVGGSGGGGGRGGVL